MEWEISEGQEAGWHVVIGDNGSGKSTFLRSIALALIGVIDAGALRQSWKEWVYNDQEEGKIEAQVNFASQLDMKAGRKKKSITRNQKTSSLQTTTFSISRQGGLREKPFPINEGAGIWMVIPGQFSASYGPFRRFRGGDQDSQHFFQSNPRLAAHLSLFGENIALTETLDWLQHLQFKKLEQQKEAKLLVDNIVELVNQGDFLPHKTKLHKISSDGVTFIDGNGCQIGVENLSDGYRSVLSMTFELIRQMTRSYALNQIFDRRQPGKIIAPGIVLIDEIDAHLHPTWQRRIGLWFREHFPNIQFIVTTHSPLICQAAEVGTVWRLPKPGTEEKAKMITGTDLERLLHGNVLDAYGTELFGENVARSEKSQEMMGRLAELNLKEMNSGLTKKEELEQAQLRAAMPTTAHQTSKRKRRNGHD